MSEENIKIYKINSLYNDLQIYVNKIKSNIKKGDNALKEICNEINNYMRGLFDDAICPTERKIQLIARGGSSVCYRSTDNENEHPYVYKVFFPLDFSCSIPYEKTKNVKEQFCLIPDCAEPESRVKFLRRFVRFIGQKEEIELCRRKAKDNLFQSPTLCFSSKGFAYEIELLDCKGSETLKEKFANFIPSREKKEKPSLENFKKILNLVNEMAKNIRDFCHYLGEESEKNASNKSQDKIFHGDIKPENFLVINTRKAEDKYFIRNIDFDTWVSAKKIEEGYLEDFAASTDEFYDIDEEHTNKNQAIEDWLCYDVQALGRVLMYACALLVGDDDILKKVKIKNKSEWKKYFFKNKNDENYKNSCPAKVIFELMGANKNLSDLLVFEQFKELLLWCETLGKRDVKDFIIKLSEIEQLVGGQKTSGVNEFVIKLSKVERLSEEQKMNAECLFLRYLGLKRLDVEIKNETPFARQNIDEFIIEAITADGKTVSVANYDYDTLSGIYSETNPKTGKIARRNRLALNFVNQVLNKSFKVETGVN